MRLLHTSDWHLGRSFHREDMLVAQAQFIDFLVQTVIDERIDAVLVAGDIYDRALPSVDAVSLCNDALARLAAAGTRVVLISGNHDSPTRLGFGAALIDSAGIHLRSDPARCAIPVVLGDEHGDVAVYAVPYLEPDAVRTVLDCGGGHCDVLSAAMDRVRLDLRRRDRPTRSAVLAHAFVAGGEASESERDISVGGVSAVAPSVFDGVDYVALGHLHGAQMLADSIRYSGSPLAYSFSEEHHRKGMWLVQMPGRGASASFELIATPVPRPLKRLRGQLDDLLRSRKFAPYERHFLHITLVDPARPRDAMDRLRARFPHVLVLVFEPEGSDTAAQTSYTMKLAGRSDIDVATDFVSHVRSNPDDAEIALLARSFADVRQREIAR